MLDPNNSRFQDVVETLKVRKEHGYDYRALQSIVTSLGPFVDGGFYAPGETFTDLSRDFSELSDAQKNDLEALYRAKLKMLEEQFNS